MAMAFWTLACVLVALSLGLGWLDQDRLRARVNARRASRQPLARQPLAAPAGKTPLGLPDTVS